MKRGWIVTGAFIAISALCGGTAVAASAGVVVRSTKGEFAEVKDRLVRAIEDRGLVVNYTARIGAMLERTGKDIGAARKIYTDAEMLEFCSAGVSRAAMEADPANIAFCPYGIAIYAVQAEPGRVFLAYRSPAAPGTSRSAKALRDVDKLLAGIVAEALK